MGKEILVVQTEHLGKLATVQDETANNQTTSATAAADNLSTAVWVSHGIVSLASNMAFTKAAAARRAAGEAAKKASTGLAGKLRIASTVYQGADELAAKNIAKQVVER